MSPRVVGLDLSIASTGWADLDAAAPLLARTGVFASAPPENLRPRSMAWYRSSFARINQLAVQCADLASAADLVVVETPALYAKGSALDRMFAMWWMVAETLDRLHVPWAPVTPDQIKMYATGKGKAAKDAVLAEVIRRFPGRVGGFDEADAMTAAAMGCDHLGCPVAAMPERNRSTLARVEWPAPRPSPDGRVTEREGTTDAR